MKQGRVYIIKRGKRPNEEFSPEKLHQSIVAACLSVRTPVGQAEEIAKTVTLDVMHWCEIRPEITSSDIRRRASRLFHSLHTDAAYVYEQQKTIV